jgi:4-hydroxybenzoate polyprenyltransferase
MSSASTHRAAHGRFAALHILHPFPSLLVAGLTAALVLFAADEDRLRWAIWLGVVMLCYQFAVGITNDLRDADLDQQHKPWKPIPAGIITPRAGSLLAAAFIFAGLVISMPLPIGAWLVGVAGLACGLIYNAALKRTWLSWLPFAVAIPLIPIWVFLAVGAWDALLWWVFPLGLLLGLALHLSNQVPDIDRESGQVPGLAHLLGRRRATQFAFSSFGLAASLAVIVLLARDSELAFVMAAAGFATALASLRAPRVLGRDGLFVAFAAGSGLLAVIFVAAI